MDPSVRRRLAVSFSFLAFSITTAFAEDPPALGQLKSDEHAQEGPAAPEAHGSSAHHMKMPAASSDDCRKTGGFVDHVSPAQQAIINTLIATRSHRLSHALWHAVRGGLTEKETAEAVTAFGASWGQDHPYCPPPKADSSASDYNPVGEDFLYMHRQMIGAVRGALVAGKQQCISGFSGIPDPTQWPLPDSDVSGAKSPQTLAQLKAWDGKLEDPQWLASVSLSQLGMAIELTTHNNLHMRYATTNPPAGFPGAVDAGGAPVPYDGKFPADWPYDKPAYDWLADPYGAAVNPIFWKIHGYVDHLVDLWLAANNFTSISDACGKTPACYQWKGKWTGDMPNWIDAPADAIAAPGGKKGAKAAPALDPKTKLFTQQRMRKQWLGVIGAPAPGGAKGPPRASLPQTSADPFQYAVEQACGKQP